MQNVLIEKPYQFIPPLRIDWIPKLIRDTRIFHWALRRDEGVTEFECRHVDRLKSAIERGDSIIVAPNHCRTADPLVVGELARQARCLFYSMASWHLYHESRFKSFAMRALGTFSVYREGIDRKAIDTAIGTLLENKRPLLIFPEGTTSRSNDQLMKLLDGMAFIARRAAKQRQKLDQGRVVVVPVAIKYVMKDPIEKVAPPVLTKLESQLGWRPQSHLKLLDRVERLERAMLAIRECDSLGMTLAEPDLDRRRQELIERVLTRQEEQWLGEPQSGSPVVRVKNLRMKMVPELLSGKLDQDTHQRYWQQLSDSYYAQQMGYFVPNYIRSLPTIDRIRETIEKIEDGLNDESSLMGPLKAIVHVDHPIEVSATRTRNGSEDGLMLELADRLQTLLDELALESTRYDSDG